ncbi:ornithine carbamoyltransferase, partial [Bacteroidota bacterium]
SKTEIEYLLKQSQKLKKQQKKLQEKKHLKGKNIALIFEKSSTRTRCAFEVAAYQQGANVTYLSPSNSQFGYKETVEDSARVLGRMYDAIGYRGFSQQTVEKLAKFSGIPVWNGLTNEFHPTQILADFLTMIEHSKKPLINNKLCYIGNADNNVSNSLMIGSAILGLDFRIIAPAEFQPAKELVEFSNKLTKGSKGKLTISENIENTIKGVDFIYTDVWLSMGEPEEEWKKRIDKLLSYQVNNKILSFAENPDVKFLHCLPAFHNIETKIGAEIHKKYGLEAMEVTEDVFESKHSIVFDQAENRLHTIKAVMLATLGNK